MEVADDLPPVPRHQERARRLPDGLDAVELSECLAIHVTLPESLGKPWCPGRPDFPLFVGLAVDSVRRKGATNAAVRIRAWATGPFIGVVGPTFEKSSR